MPILPNRLVFPEAFEAVGGQFGVANRVLDVLVAKILLDGTGIVTIIRKLVASGMTKHVRVNWKIEVCIPSRPGNHLSHRRIHSGTYRAPPVRRVNIPKPGSSETRPIGIPSFEDKLLQRAVLMLLEPLYEQDFYDCSYGCRPGRSTHQAIDATWKHTMDVKGGLVLEVDLRKFFDTLDHSHLRTFLQQRVRDGVVLRLIGKWLNAGIMDHGNVSYPDQGSPQGGCISPILANAYLHYVMDEWFHRDVLPRMRARAFLVRYADDVVMIFELESDARRVLAVLGQRCAKYGLTIHPEKTRLIDFRRPTLARAKGRDSSKSSTFDLLGFTHYGSRSRSGHRIVKRKTVSSRLTRSVQAL